VLYTKEFIKIIKKVQERFVNSLSNSKTKLHNLEAIEIKQLSLIPTYCFSSRENIFLISF